MKRPGHNSLSWLGQAIYGLDCRRVSLSFVG